MKVLKWLVILVLVLIAALVGAGFFLPDRAHVERSTVVNAPVPAVFALLNGFRRFQEWSPWLKYDPAAKVTTEGPPWGVGARQSWAGNDQVGSGSQEIVATNPWSDITIKLVFADFGSENTARYVLAPEGEATRVTWSYDSAANGNLLYRYFGLMADKMLGPDYEDGLAKLKTVAETLPRDDFREVEAELVQTQAMPIAYVAGEAPADQAANALAAAYAKVQAFMAANNLKQAAMPLAVTREFNDETKYWKFDAAIPLDQVCTAPEGGEVGCGSTYAGYAIKAVHRGAYEAAEPTYNKLLAFKNAAGLQDNGNSWEHYVVDPATAPQAEWVTHIYWPVK